MLARTPKAALGWLLLSILFVGTVRAEPRLRAPIRDPAHTFSKRVPSLAEWRQRNIVMQRRDYSCGAAALATVARFYWGDRVGEEFFLDALGGLLTEEEAKDRVENGLSMSDLRRAAVKTGYQAAAAELTFAKLTEARVPLIVGITVEEHDHFVVYRGAHGRWVYLADPIRGNVRVSVPTFLKQWQKNAVLAIHKPGRRVRTGSPLSVREAEIKLGEVNRQLIRTVPSRQFPVLARPVK